MARNFIDRVSLSEKDIEDYLFDNPREVNYGLCRVDQWLTRQLNVPSGIIDLLGQLDDGRLIVVEVKLGAIDGKAISQCARYALDIECVMANAKHNAGYERDDKSKTMQICKMVIGASIDRFSIHECYATGTNWMTFSPMLSLKLEEPDFTPEYLRQTNGTFVEMSKGTVLSDAYRRWIAATTDDEAMSEADAIANKAFNQ